MKITNGDDFNFNSIDISMQHAILNSIKPENNKKRK